MENEKLLELLRYQADNLNALLETILVKQRAIVANDITAIENATASEEKLLLAVNQAEKARVEFMNGFYDENLSKFSTVQMDDFLNMIAGTLEPLQKEEINLLRKEIKNISKEIIKINEQNKFLIAQSRKLINEVVTAIFSERGNSLLDRKV